MDATDKVAAELRELRRSVSDLSRRLMRAGDRRVDEATDAIDDASGFALRHVKQAAEDIEHRLARLEKTAGETIREHPRAVAGSVVGLALVAVLLAFLFRRDR